MNYAKHLLDIMLKLVDAKPAVGVLSCCFCGRSAFLHVYWVTYNEGFHRIETSSNKQMIQRYYWLHLDFTCFFHKGLQIQNAYHDRLTLRNTCVYLMACQLYFVSNYMNNAPEEIIA